MLKKLVMGLLLLALPAVGQESVTLKENSKELPYKSKGHDEYFTGESAHTLQITARQCMRGHNYARAIPLLEKSLKLDPNDLEAHCLYAQALQEKLEEMEEKDPRLFNKVVSIWLSILRNEVGEEKGLSYKGLSIDNGAFGDDDTVIRAKMELRHLTGYVPRAWETDEHYLTRVLKKARTKVTARILMKSEESKAENHQAK